MMSSVVLVTGAATGIGALAVRSMALAGHVVYASMRDVNGRNTSSALSVSTRRRCR
jgi:NAD(P)-dependent dehydrogenase (short-subunit alcohol dehydrogenase family)